jgi:hypothetical protein
VPAKLTAQISSQVAQHANLRTAPLASMTCCTTSSSVAIAVFSIRVASSVRVCEVRCDYKTILISLKSFSFAKKLGTENLPKPLHRIPKKTPHLLTGNLGHGQLDSRDDLLVSGGTAFHFDSQPSRAARR